MLSTFSKASALAVTAGFSCYTFYNSLKPNNRSSLTLRNVNNSGNRLKLKKSNNHFEPDHSEEKKKRKQIRKQERKKLKEELLKQKELQISQQLFSNYSNIDNPFNDQNLNQKFVWEKKRESELKRGLTTKDLEILDRKKKEQTRLQLEELKKKREQREIELKLLEESKLQLQRDLDRQEMGDWEEKEEEFHLAQAKKRAEIRLEQGRALPIDILALNLSIANDDGLEKKDEFEETNKLKLEMDIQEPYLITQNLSMAQLETLYQDIQYYISLEKNEKNKNFWASMIIVVDSELEKLKLKQDTRLRQGVSESVREQIEKMLSTKTLEQLDQLQKEVEGKLKGGGPVRKFFFFFFYFKKKFFD
ncbi:hypothetical protein HK099_006961 [Clydaea vesicula]|uniref:Splicing factor cactin central domain-containing protein n=1 Tax=Clydaea vesicula TaxID=447962 RepID=A0AAD5TWZ0_9FUNG|nr:hypothetical protein HK099_006961 [Clydaea vesicula]